MNIVRQFWTHGHAAEYLATLWRFAKWRTGMSEGDTVVLQEDGLVPLSGPLPGSQKSTTEKMVWCELSSSKSGSGTYKRPITKITPLLYLGT